jgi:sigma-54 dependent transcriptional regulator, acetoin dehydrogenase operon transcriptional activator AcoR
MAAGKALEPMQRQLQQARACFAEGGALPDSLLPAPLARSWERSRQAGLLPGHAPNYEALQPRGNPREHPDDRRLVHSVEREIEQLWQAFGGRDWTVFCVNPHGMIVHRCQHHDADPRLLQPIQVGRRIQEIDIGTTAPSCALAEDAPVLVRGNQHYLDAFAPVFCLSVPLHGLEGELVGALDITGIGERDPELLLAQFRQAALAAENRLYAGVRDCHLLRLRYDPRWGDSPLQGLLAVRPDGSLRAANRIARRLLGLPLHGALEPLPLEALFAFASQQQRRRLLQPGAARRVPLADGTALWVELWRSAQDRTAAGASRMPALGSAPTLRAQARQGIEQALRDNGGNIAATARQLGISRTTLYKKLA